MVREPDVAAAWSLSDGSAPGAASVADLVADLEVEPQPQTESTAAVKAAASGSAGIRDMAA
jgi:hypothetical protein